MDSLPVVFRHDGESVTAIFPTLPADRSGDLMTCYAHIGQHGACSREWYQETRPATESERAPLLAELSAIYGRDPDRVTLRPVARISRAMDRARRAAA